MEKKYLVIDTHADEYAENECTSTMTVGRLIKYLQLFDPDTPIVVGNNRQPDSDRPWWWTYGNITADRIIETYVDDDDDGE